MPDANAVSRMADDRYLGVWLNGIEERQARWYLKEGIPCFIAKEITSLERAQLAAPETMIDFAAGSSAASLHWGVNDYDSLALSRGDLSLRDTSSFHDPGWVWSEPPVQKDKFPAKEPPRTQVANWAWSDPQVQKGKSPIKEPPKPQTVDYGPPPAETVIIAKDRVPWIKPPPVKRAAPSRPGAPPHEQKKWIKWVENYQPKGSFREVGAKFIPDHHSHSMYDRDKHHHLFFLHPPRAPEGCVSNPDVFGMPCPKGIYKDMNKNRRPQPYWIYKTQEPQSADVGKIAPVPRPEDLPCLNRTPLPPPDDDSDSDDDYYPDMDFLRQSVQNRAMTTDVSSKSATAMPAAQDIGTRSSLSAPTVKLNAVISSVESEPAALGATIEPGVGSSESTQIPPPLPAPVLNHPRNEDEVSIGDEDSIHEAMGPQIPPLTFTVDSEIEVEEAPPTDPLEFASSFLMLYGLPASEEFSTIQNLIASIAAHLQLTVRQIFRVCSDRSQNFWFEMESVDQARQMRTYMHHRRENSRELLVAYADYGDYVRALARSSHRWPDSTTIVEDQRPFPTPGPTASSSSRGRDVRERHKSRDVRQRSPSADRYHTGRRPSPLPQRRSPVHSDYLRRRYQRSPSPHYREHAPYRRSRSPEPRLFRPSRDTIPVGSQENRSNFNSVAAPNVDTGATVQIPPLPVLPSGPAFVGLPHNAPLPFGANVAFMWSPSGNTFSPVLLQGNTTIIPFPMPSSKATPSALLPWPVAAVLPSTTALPSFTPTQPTEPLASRISSTQRIPSGSPPPTPVQPTLMSRMTEHLSARLSDAVPSNLATRLSNPAQWTLADRISEDGPMGSSASWNGLTSWGGTVQPATAPLVTPEDLHPTPDSMDEDPVDLEDDREPDYKRTKRGRRSGQKIQGYRKRDEEREERKRRHRRC
ncbi:uncharacterized protein LACBIDRAFT_316546 [Laccaria bicolor S238N-H82]|uniref:Predicted protein n=1 Tax=Laccaria bicolor (strain S238N-H82 / ATCC MYA-4686) TaxID=486041 RepID=B0E148_LACBS|nr:uncharacterized protein LACBIDRAFT_316546 [Laccaria bicolor S238N-H82]EDQ99451.1 predicted protein [Laccaria bicolor S238N-H82]|eukprot:XP_001889906.1 predicted protein [Laccaria bicolor S238N-H82]